MLQVRFAGLLGAALSLTSCTGAPIMKADVSDYRSTFSDTNDEQILMSVLRARDGAPLHFSEMSTFGASMQLTSSLQATTPVGENYGATTRAGLQGNLGAQNNPTFSLSTLETQAFTQGLLSPVKPTLLKQFFDEGIDRRLLLLLMFSSIQDRHGGLHRNTLDCDPPSGDCKGEIFGYLETVNTLARRKLISNIYTDLTQIGAAVPYKDTVIKDLAGLDPQKFRVRVSMTMQDKPTDKSTVSVSASGNASATATATGKDDPQDPAKKSAKIQVAMATVYAISEPRFELCELRSTHALTFLSNIVSGAACMPEYLHASPTPISGRNTLQVRSTYQIIEYLGQVLAYQQRKDDCIKLGYPNYSCDSGDVMFQVNSPRGDRLVSTTYQGQTYSVALGHCIPEKYCDHSAEVMKILSLLINVNKSATDIQQIPLVRVQ